MTVSVQQKLAWAKALAALKRDISGNGVSVPERIRKAKEMAQIKRDLGGAGKEERVTFPEMTAEEMEGLPSLELPEDIGQGARKNAVKAWLQENVQGKSVRASDGKLIQFQSKDIGHLAFNGRRKNLIAALIPHIVSVFTKGQYVGVESPKHSRKDTSIIAFHVYRKWVKLENGYKIYLEAHAAERETGKFEFSAYNLKKTEAVEAPEPDNAMDGVRNAGYGLTAWGIILPFLIRRKHRKTV